MAAVCASGRVSATTGEQQLRIQGYLENRADRIQVTCRIVGYDENVIDREVSQGMRSEIRFSIRIHRRFHGIRRVFGDAVLGEDTVIRSARWDPFRKQYTVTTGTVTREFENREEFLSEFLELSGHDLSCLTETEFDADTMYVTVRAEIEPVSFIPALSLLRALPHTGRAVTPWHRVGVR
jgi:hypothetical protein